jgi:hypothetical protein
MQDIEAVSKYLNPKGLINIYLPIDKLNIPIIQAWISKSKYEINRYAQHILSLHNFKKEKSDFYTCQAIHESLNGCSVSIVFALFNIFASITKTQASFFDQSIRDYFAERIKLNSQESYLLSFYWHEPVLAMNSLGYSAEQYLKICFCDNGIAFKVMNPGGGNSSDLEHSDNEEITNSLQFYSYHLFQLLSAIDLLTNLLYPETTQNQTTSYLPIENYQDLYIIYEDIFKEN